MTTKLCNFVKGLTQNEPTQNVVNKVKHKRYKLDNKFHFKGL